MTNKVKKIRNVGTVSSRGEIPALLKQSGDVAIVKRGVLRSIVMLCPCGCREQITINLDKRSAAAWHLYQKGKTLTLYPSVWRDNGCCSHFIIWNDRIFWCDYESLIDSKPKGVEFETKIINLLSNNNFLHYSVIADKICEVPWAVYLTCRKLVKDKILIEGVGNAMGKFRFLK